MASNSKFRESRFNRKCYFIFLPPQPFISSTLLRKALTIRSSQQGRIFGLDVMRAIAILSVVVAHSRGILKPLHIDLEFLRFSAFAGVEIFFVLSGFLIGTILIKIINRTEFKSADLTQFWIRRWFRTLPNYYMVLVLLLILHTVMQDPVPFNWKFLFFLQNFLTPHPAFFGEAWSLSVEEWFYLLFPFTLFICLPLLSGSSKKQVILIVILFFLILFNAIRIYYTLNFDPEWNLGVRRVVVCRLDSIMYGVLGAWIAWYHKDSWIRMKKAGIAIGALLFTFCVWHFFRDLMPDGTRTGNFFSDTFYFALFSFSIACFLPALSEWKQETNAVASKAITHISVISYSVYLLHFALVFKAFNLLHGMQSTPMVIGKYFLYWVVVMLLATVNYNLFELPATRMRNRFSSDKEH